MLFARTPFDFESLTKSEPTLVSRASVSAGEWQRSNMTLSFSITSSRGFGFGVLRTFRLGTFLRLVFSNHFSRNLYKYTSASTLIVTSGSPKGFLFSRSSIRGDPFLSAPVFTNTPFSCSSLAAAPLDKKQHKKLRNKLRRNSSNSRQPQPQPHKLFSVGRTSSLQTFFPSTWLDSSV